MTKKISKLLSDLNFNSINKLSFQNEEKRVAVEFIDDKSKIHRVEFSNVDTYFFLDENLLEGLHETMGSKKPITFFDMGYGEFVAIDEFEDGTISEKTIAQPNVILNTDTASIVMEAKKVKINGISYQLDRFLN